jgi:hypothetical protein
MGRFEKPSALSCSFFKQGGRLRRPMKWDMKIKHNEGIGRSDNDGKSDSECDQGPARNRRREGSVPRSNTQDGSYSAVDEDQELEQIYQEIAADWQAYHQKEKIVQNDLNDTTITTDEACRDALLRQANDPPYSQFTWREVSYPNDTTITTDEACWDALLHQANIDSAHTSESTRLMEVRQIIPSVSVNGQPESRQSGPHRCERIDPRTERCCNINFLRRSDLTRHENRIHNMSGLKCVICPRKRHFNNRDALTRHNRMVHSEIEFPDSPLHINVQHNPNPCDLCRKRKIRCKKTQKSDKNCLLCNQRCQECTFT